MKKILTLLALAGLIFQGCTDIKLNNVTPPVKGTFSLISIPGKTGLSSETAFSTTSTIDGSVGGTMTMNQSYMGDNGRQVTLSLIMTIPPGAFSGVKTITLTADDHYAALICTPSMAFDKSLSLDFSYTGLSLNSTNLANGRQGFYFISDSGDLENIANNSMVINKNLGRVLVNGAVINHFSRYGWATIDGGND
jgi:hypothetical protein